MPMKANNTRIATDEIQPLLLDILVEFDSFCRINELEYFLCSGTLLGAIRHNGFIPWDDDVDVGMLWDSYSKLLDILQENPYIDAEKRYRVLAPSESTNCYPFIKVVDTTTIVYERNIDKRYSTGLWLDVFCFAGYPDNEEEARTFCRRILKLKQLNKVMICGNIADDEFRRVYPLARIARGIMMPFVRDPLYFSKRLIQMERRYLNNPTAVGDVCWAPGVKKRFNIDYFQKTIPLSFEGHDLPGPSGYDGYLSQIFGDYMKLPPESQRVRHEFEAYYV